MTKHLISISKTEGLEEKRDYATLDKIIELIFANFKQVDKIKSFQYDKKDFEAIIFDFVKNEHSIYVSLNSQYSGREIKTIIAAENFNKELKIVENNLLTYNEECTKFFKERFDSLFTDFLNKFSDKLINFTNPTPSLDNKKQVFENIINEMRDEKEEKIKNGTSDFNVFLKKMNQYRE